MHSSESSPQSGSTFLHSQNSEERPRSILKNSSSILMKKTSSGEKRMKETPLLGDGHQPEQLPPLLCPFLTLGSLSAGMR